MSCTDKSIYSKVLMVGDYAGADAVGGMASVIQNYRKLVPHLNYIYTWRPSSSKVYKLAVLLASYVRMIIRLLTDRNIEIVHIHTCSGASFWRCEGFVNLAGAFGKKVVLHMHGGRFKEFYAESGKPGRIIDIISIFRVFFNLLRNRLGNSGRCLCSSTERKSTEIDSRIKDLVTNSINIFKSITFIEAACNF